MNMDTGNTFIAGQDPVAFLNRFKHKVSHVHVKDVSQSLAASMRGELTGIAVSPRPSATASTSTTSAAASTSWLISATTASSASSAKGKAGR
jgi:hypothetical protein